MSFPNISIPDIPTVYSLPLPELSHPIVVHLTIALPIVVALIEIINLIARKKLLGSISFLFITLFSILLFETYSTGLTDAKLITDSINISKETLTLYNQHKIDGIYLVYGSFVLLVIKLLSVVVRKIGVKILFLLFLLVYSAILFNVTLKGTKLVYKHRIICSSKELSKVDNNSTTKKKVKIEEKEMTKTSQN